MTPFELCYWSLSPLLPPLHAQMRRRIKAVAAAVGSHPQILDVGGRKSHYTIGVPGDITITDLPRVTGLQAALHLGVTDAMAEQTKARRSNVKTIVYDDMTCSSLPDHAFDCVVAVEVIEHVEEDHRFIEHVHRVLKPGGTLLMSTPNGDYVPNTNPDHKRHYSRGQLEDLLGSCFDTVAVEYAVRGGAFRRWGLRSWSVRKPWVTAASAAANIVNTVQSANPALSRMPHGTHHLIATAHKRASLARHHQS